MVGNDLCMHFVWSCNLALFISLLCFYFLNSSKPVETDRLFECLPESMRPSSESPGNPFSGKNNHHEHQNGTSETGGFKHLTLIPPRILPLLHDLALQMVQAGNQQQLLRIYRY